MINPQEVSCCLITKDATYPKEILDTVVPIGFGEILILTNSDSPYRKHELFAKAKHELLFYQDDDALCPIWNILIQATPDIITVAMKQGHYDAYKDHRLTMGIGWGCIIPKDFLKQLKLYTDVYGEDFIFKRETERILTYLNYPQNRLVLPIVDLPTAMAADRLSMQPDHYSYIDVVEERCAELIKDVPIK